MLLNELLENLARTLAWEALRTFPVNWELAKTTFCVGVNSGKMGHILPLR